MKTENEDRGGQGMKTEDEDSGMRRENRDRGMRARDEGSGMWRGERSWKEGRGWL